MRLKRISFFISFLVVSNVQNQFHTKEWLAPLPLGVVVFFAYVFWVYIQYAVDKERQLYPVVQLFGRLDVPQKVDWLLVFRICRGTS